MIKILLGLPVLLCLQPPTGCAAEIAPSCLTRPFKKDKPETAKFHSDSFVLRPKAAVSPKFKGVLKTSASKDAQQEVASDVKPSSAKLSTASVAAELSDSLSGAATVHTAAPSPQQILEEAALNLSKFKTIRKRKVHLCRLTF